METAKKERIVSMAERVFKLALLLYVALGACSLTYGKSIISVVLRVVFPMGALVLLGRLLSLRRYNRMPLLLCAAGMVLSYILSAVCNPDYITKNSVVYGILWIFFFFVLYTRRNGSGSGEAVSEFRVFSLVFMVGTTVLVILGLALWLTGYTYSYRDPDNGNYEVAVGFFSGRLWGAFQDPNLGSVMCCAALAMGGYWFKRSRKILARVLLAADFALLVFYMAMSDSRNGMVCLGVLFAVSVWFRLSRRKGRRTGLFYAVGAVLICVALVMGALLPAAVQRVYNFAVSENESQFVEESGALQQVDRGYSMEGDISNRRFAIWQSGLEIGLSRPLVGVSYTGLVPYAKEYMPDTYIVNNDIWEFNTLDSEPVNIFASQGFLGLFVLLVWFLLAAGLFMRRRKTIPAVYAGEFSAMTAVCCILITSALFQGTMFYQMTPNTVIFWICFGDVLYLLRNAAAEEGRMAGEEDRPVG